MIPGRKHISELSEFIGESRRIGFKLETGVELNELHNRAKEQLKKYGVDATIANLLEEINNDQTPRAYLVTSDGMQALQSILDVCEAILDVLTK